ncbi:MAG: Sensor histidine kinase RcsC [Verrucomicrobiae bacterium]|nr:Sensor histidine kinase RcsC [Verrucomicrobiae bacterium]
MPSLRVLILEDQPADAELVLRALRRAGYEPLWDRVDTEDDFLARLSPDWELILSDYQMPQFDGLRALQILRKRGLDIPFIIVSGTIGEDLAVAAMRSGATDYLLKDRLTRLGQAVAHALDEKRHRDETRLVSEALIQAERKYRGIFENVTEGIAQIRPNGQLITANPALAHILGYPSPVELLADVTHIMRQLYVDDQQPATLARLLTEQDAVVDFEAQLRRRDGQVIWVMQSVRAVRDELGRLQYYEGSVRDITERKRAEVGLRELAEFNQGVLDSLTSHICVLDRNGAILSVNRAWRIFAAANPPVTSPVNVGANYYAVCEAAQGADAATARETLAGLKAVAQGELPEFTCEYPCHSPETQRWFMLRASPIPGAGAACVVVAHLNITERKRAEQVLQETNFHLDAALEKLQAAQKQLVEQERLHALGQMASGIAHDFNNALAPILGFSELLLHRPEKAKDPATLASFLQMINTSARDATHVVRRLREFYRHRERGEVFLPVNLNHLILQTVALTEPRWKEQMQGAGVTIDVRSELGNIPHVYCDESELREMLTNLIFNAVDAMPAGGTITVRTKPLDKRVLFEISDTGTGMTDEVRHRCLEPFFSTKGEHGTGLGLAMVYGVVKRHEGHLEIRTELGKGTTFAIEFPIETLPQSPLVASPPPTAPQTLHILLVDDERMILDVLTDYLTGDGHAVATATGCEQALAKFTQAKFDLVITDRSMPGGSGEQLAAALKARQPSIPVVMLTGFGGIMDATTDRPAGVDYLLSKPVTLAEIQRVVAQACPANQKEIPS